MVTLSVLIPVYNEEKTVGALLQAVRDAPIGDIKKELVVVDDCSTDSTLTLLKKEPGITLLHHAKNQGKGRAVRTALKHATGDIIVVQDADLEYDPADYIKLLTPILNESAKVVYGSRFLAPSWDKNETIVSHWIGNVGLSIITSILYGQKITDMETCYKMMKTDVARSLHLRGTRFDIEPEITAKLIRKGYRIREVPIRFSPRSFQEGKKITWRDGIIALYYLLKYRFF